MVSIDIEHSYYTHFEVQFRCVNCNATIHSGVIDFPTPNIESESHAGSIEADGESVCCPNCDKEYDITAYAGISGSGVTISDIEDEDILGFKTLPPDEELYGYSSMFRLNKLHIENFKNLKQQTFDFTNHNGLTLLIGNNSSGKSNLIEAICGVFYSLYERYEWRKQRCKAIPNKFEIEYTSRSFKNRINVDATRYQAFNNVLSNNNPITTPDLPSRIVAIYSGEEDRLKQHYFDPFLKKYRQGNQLKMPSMFFLNKDHWDIALLCLLYSDRKNETSFVSELLGGIIVSDVRINFNASNIVSLERYNNLLIYHLNIHCNEQGLISIEDIATIIDYDVRELFQSLYIAKTQTKATIRSIDFNFAQEDDNQPSLNYRDTRSVAIHKYCLQSLSEGQKKLILITAAMEFAGQENSLFLLDEPDAHVHLSNKHKIIDIVKKYTHNRHIIITTHSPTLCRYIGNKDSIMMLENGESKSVGDQLEAAINLVGNKDAVNLLFSTTPLVLVEGVGDVDYIKKAIEVLSDGSNEYTQIKWEILPMGGAGNAKYFIDNIINCVSNERDIIIILDRDSAGADALKEFGITGGRSNNNTYVKGNCYFLMLPKTSEHTFQDFVIEDYFSMAYKKNIALSKIECLSGCFNEFPKDIKEKTKSHLKTELNSHPKEVMLGFSVLLNKIQGIINRTELFTEI